ncbi:MAG TPA: hypothetical protein VGX16_05540 [Solirubrobacteraceae bacterium]|nr:hypothetical protein [Solirubrobacteraceae bacterium]
MPPRLSMPAAAGILTAAGIRRAARVLTASLAAPLLSAALACTAASAAPLGGVNVLGLGSGPFPAQVDADLATASALHARVVRTYVPWSALQPHGPGSFDPRALAFLDRLTADASARGIGVIMIVDSTPCWASSAPAELLRACASGRPEGANAWPPRDPGDYANAMALLARRYGPTLAALEVWNEPDQANEDYLAGPEKPERYAALLRAAYPAIKQADPAVPVLAGSLVGSNGVFLHALYAAGIQGYYDGLSVHFYNLLLGSLRAIHETQLAAGDHTPLWLDEFGWPSCWPRLQIEQEQGCVTPGVQARNIADTIRSLARTPWVAAEVLYKLHSSSAEDFGLTDASTARGKPAFAALARALASPFGAPSRVVLHLRRRRGRVIASGSGPVGDYMRLEALRGKRLRYSALFTLDRFDRYSIALPRSLGTHGLRVRVHQYWAGLARDTQASI